MNSEKLEELGELVENVELSTAELARWRLIMNQAVTPLHEVLEGDIGFAGTAESFGVFCREVEKNLERSLNHDLVNLKTFALEIETNQ